MTSCPPHPRDKVEKLSGSANDAFFLCSDCGREFEGEYSEERGGYIET